MISAVVFVFWPEEEGLIETCLKSLSFASEIVVIDAGATERTVMLARKYTKRIYKDSSKDFAERHNRALEKVSGEWVLYVDADERISKALSAEIHEKTQSLEYAAYQVPRVSYFLGKAVRYGDRFPDYVTRLFKKSNLKGWYGSVHESSDVSGKVGKLSNPMYHLTHRDIYSMMRKTIIFSEYEAKLRLVARHPPVVWWRLVRVFLTEFYSRLFGLSGWRQGTEGWIDGIFQAFSLFIVYAKLWELQRKPRLEETYKEIDKKILSEFE